MSKKGLVALLTNHDDDVYCFRKELVEGLIDDGYEVLISCPHGEKLEMMKHVNYIYDDAVIDRRGMNVFKDFRLYRHYKKLFKEHRPCAVLTYTAKPNVYGAAAARALKIPYICNVTGFGGVMYKNKLLRLILLKLYAYSYKRAYHVFFQNNDNLCVARKNHMLGSSYSVIPGSGVALDRFPPIPYMPSEEKIVFNYIGRVLREKGIDEYLAAARIIKSKYPNTEFNLIGFVEPTEKHYEIELKDMEKNGIINYLGQQKDVRPFIKASHALILPSYGEGMSNVLLENAASARPSITTDVHGCRDIVEDGVTGILCKVKDTDSLVFAIEKFLSMDNAEREKMGQAGRAKIEKEFSRDIVVKNYLKVLNTVPKGVK